MKQQPVDSVQSNGQIEIAADGRHARPVFFGETAHDVLPENAAAHGSPYHRCRPPIK